MTQIPECYYRVSVKALVLNETRDKFLVLEDNIGCWELPGGGLDWGVTPQEDLPREIAEEMSVEVLEIADHPCYFMTEKLKNKEAWKACVIYETKLKSLDFKASDECVDIKFVDKADVAKMPVNDNVKKLAEMFDPSRH